MGLRGDDDNVDGEGCRMDRRAFGGFSGTDQSLPISHTNINRGGRRDTNDVSGKGDGDACTSETM